MKTRKYVGYSTLQSAIWAAPRRLAGGVCLALMSVLGAHPVQADSPGVTETTIRIGGVMDLEGASRGLGQGMKTGIEAALQGETVQGRKIEFIALNDYYDPPTTVKATEQLIGQEIFLMLGNVGTPTAKVSLPVLARHKVPAMGFFTGAGILRPGVGDIINFRASYVQETAVVIEAALAAGVKPGEVCAYVQNDAYGMAGIAGVKAALGKRSGNEAIVEKLDQIMAMQGPEPARNGIGPVGVYQRNARRAREGYDSLKAWEAVNGTRCRLVVGVGTYAALSDFEGYSSYKGEDWVLSAVSFTGADNFATALASYNVTDRTIMTQVVPPLNSSLPIVEEARAALGTEFGYVSLEGYIVGKLFLAAMNRIEGDITRENFLKAIRNQRFDLGGIGIDFSDDNQGSDLVSITYLSSTGFEPITPDFLRKVFE